jgi:ABC-type Zn uptake system ZnuABC Zn-binding protein ZnuA
VKKISKSKQKTTPDGIQDVGEDIPNLEGIIPPGMDPSLYSSVEDYLTRSDQAAAVFGNSPSMDSLVEKAKDGDHRAFMSLIKINTSLFPLAYLKSDAFYFPSLYANKEFYSLDWVQDRLRNGFRDDPNEFFQKDFWDAIFSSISFNPAKKTSIQKSELKRYIIINKEKWNQQLAEKKQTFVEIHEHLKGIKLIDDDTYEDIDSFRRFLNLYGVKGKRGRSKNKGEIRK